MLYFFMIIPKMITNLSVYFTDIHTTLATGLYRR